jgi:hypothetical protein
MKKQREKSGQNSGAGATQWKPGQSGNRRGKPKGCKHKATQLAEQMIGDEADKIIRAVIDGALAGDATCLRLCLERIAPPLKERPVSLVLPEAKDAAGIADAQQSILDAAASGAILPSEAVILSGLVEARRRAVETQALEARITALEAAGNAA